MSYDMIGDIHGCADSLSQLLQKLGYTKTDGVYRHPSRRTAFLGDFIDRGPKQREVLNIVRPMIDSGVAVAVLGNHEFNAIAYHTPAPDSHTHLREHSVKNRQQHQAFLDAYATSIEDRAEVIHWFKTLPLWLELEGLRLVHACWDDDWMTRITRKYGGHGLSDGLLRAASTIGAWEFEAVETLLKGREVPLGNGVIFHDKDGHPRNRIRVRWWDTTATTYRRAFIGPASARSSIPDETMKVDCRSHYAPDEAPVFVGHYWLDGAPRILADNIACLDYSVAKPGGKLVAYRWNGESALCNDHFCSVARAEA